MDASLVVRMPRELRDTLERLAEDEARPVGNMVRVLLGEAIAARAKGKRRK